MENKTIEQLLSSIAALVGDARGSLFGQDKCMVDRDQLLYLVDALQSQLPTELSEAKTIIENCNALKTNAKKEAAETRKEADQVLQDAQERAAKLIEESTIVTFAKKREQEIIEEAQDQRAQLIAGAVKYADSIMKDAQQTVTQTMETLNAGVQALEKKCQEDLNAAMQQLEEARRALQNAAKDAPTEQSAQ
jgi:cell division septum initiation protein DivIVA